MAALALSLTREQFRSRFDCYFLCSDVQVARPERAQATEVWRADETTGSMRMPLPGPPFAAPLVKVHEQFPSMITLGRTQNNDVVVADTSISKFHAYFRVVAGALELADAGSRNGSFVGERRLGPKQPVRVAPGDHLRFARLAFQILSAADCWDFLVRAQDQWDG